MRYIVLDVDLPATHPLWPNERVFKIRDTKTGHVSFGCYTKRDVAERVCERKNV